ncbi:hypothetical protein DUI87_04087 [Hirundo rustica rustica]|uniref:C-type lectin domain-containing protein n=1 Tax=Hirundo rustica rustica TaxID=333673 RepID=A0A3M0L215_HIRRU|nr:hypothetical protein DUI87_04087 [Hirundo rustica rustica]
MAEEIIYADLRHLGDGSSAERHCAHVSCPWWHRFLFIAGGLGQLILLVLVVVLSMRAYAGCKLCPQDWQLHGERCYWLSEELGNWTQGMKSCEKQNSQLVVLQDKKEKMKYNMVVRNSQHGFMKRKPCLTNLITFHNVNSVTVLVDDGRRVEAVYLSFSKTCDTSNVMLGVSNESIPMLHGPPLTFVEIAGQIPSPQMKKIPLDNCAGTWWDGLSGTLV